MSIINTKSIAISNNEQNFCFNPMTTAIGEFNVVAWFYDNNDYSDLYISVFYNKQLQTTKLLLKMSGNITLSNILKYTDDSIAAIITGDTQCVYIVDIMRTQIINTFYPENESDDILHICVDNDNEYTYLTCYDYENDTLKVHRFTDENVTQYTFTLQVSHCPQVFLENNRLIVGYIDDNDRLHISYLELNSSDFETTSVIENYNVDYLCVARYDNNRVVFGGLDSKRNIMRTDMIDLDTHTVVSKYIKSNEYKGLEIQFSSLGNKGFMITADCEKQENVLIQRFTHIGTPLYLMTRVSDNGKLWAPSFSSQGHSLLVYIKDYDTHSCVEGKWVQIGDIPELDEYYL